MTEDEKHHEAPDPAGIDPAVGDQLSEDQLGAVAGGTRGMGIEVPPDLLVTAVAATGTTAAAKLKTVVNGEAVVDGASTTYSNETFSVDYTTSS